MFWIKNKIFPFKGFNAITIYPFVFYKRNTISMRNHEKIHAAQQSEMLILVMIAILAVNLLFGIELWNLCFIGLYYVIYLLEWLIRLILHGKKRAYYRISFEAEAYMNDTNFDYLDYRKPFEWVKYIIYKKPY